MEGAADRPRLFSSLFRKYLRRPLGVESNASGSYAEAFYCREILLRT